MTSDAEHDEHSRSPSPDQSEASDAGDGAEDQDMDEKSDNQPEDGAEKKKSSNSKDPSRPRRKKARRACFACQRAHLTCGDERPCQRCIKRGLQDACQDGVRKKAKYLHDAPDVLVGPRNPYVNNYHRPQPGPRSPTYPLVGVNDMYNQRPTSATYQGYPGTSTASIGMGDGMVGTTFSNPQSPLAAQMPLGPNAGQPTVQNIAQAMQVTAQEVQANLAATGFDTNLWDPNDVSQYDFDPTTFNFGNHYGALEFGMLGHISSAAGASPPGDRPGGINQVNAFPTPNTMSTSNYSESPVTNQNFMFGQDGVLEDWRGPSQTQSNVRQSGPDFLGATRTRDGQLGMFGGDLSRAFSVGVNSAAATPTSGRSPQQAHRSLAPAEQAYKGSVAHSDQPSNGNSQLEQSASSLGSRSASFRRRRGDPSSVYSSVTQPYSYTTGFHSLFFLLQKRYAPANVIRIAKSLASIRPSFISCTKTLNREDLIFMEKCFQRTLCEYEDFINSCGTPTIICRRTGEIAAAGKEFCILTKWRKDVILGKEVNLNANYGRFSTDQQGGSSSRGSINTPRVPEGVIDDAHIHPVSLAEIMDQDSVVAFYEDFSRLAFGDPKGVVTTRYKLLRYQTKEEIARGVLSNPIHPAKRKRGIDGRTGDPTNEAGIDEIGEDGKIECSCCWTVKRDLFDLPMMIVMNFLPCI